MIIILKSLFRDDLEIKVLTHIKYIGKPNKIEYGHEQGIIGCKEYARLIYDDKTNRPNRFANLKYIRRNNNI